MTTAEYTIDNRPLKVFYEDVEGVQDILREMFVDDVYRLKELHESGVKLDLVLDLGAHMGFFASLVRHYWPDAKVVCVEPDADFADCIRNNAPKSFMMIGVAIRYDDNHHFYVAPKTGGSLIFDPTVNFSETIAQDYDYREVTTAKLEDLAWSNIGTGPIDLMKIDVEGSEWNILCGMTPPMRQRIKRMVGEFHHLAGYPYLEKILRYRFPHLTPENLCPDSAATIGLFRAF